MKEMTILGNNLSINSSVKENDIPSIDDLADSIIESME
jgi:hypothetical protein